MENSISLSISLGLGISKLFLFSKLIFEYCRVTYQKTRIEKKSLKMYFTGIEIRNFMSGFRSLIEQYSIFMKIDFSTLLLLFLPLPLFSFRLSLSLISRFLPNNFQFFSSKPRNLGMTSRNMSVDFFFLLLFFQNI